MMEASFVPPYSPNPAQTRKTAFYQTPRFKGAGEAISGVVGSIDNNRLIELIVTDGIGMILPRTGMAYKCRGADDGRETFLRELAGLVGNVLLAGWLGTAMVSALGNTVNAYNPHGIPGKAWINARNMSAFSKLYNDSLKSAQNHQEARQKFIHKVLAGLEAGDRSFSIESRLSSLKQASTKQNQQGNILQRMLETTYGKTEASTHLKNYQRMLKNGNLEGLRDQLKERWGKLSKDSQGQLALYFNQKAPGATTVKGTSRFDEEAEKLIQEAPLTNSQKAFSKKRLSLSLSQLNHHDDAFAKSVDHEALIRGLTGTVNLWDGKQLLAENLSRRTILKELKYFLEQYVDRATHAVKREYPHLQDWQQEKALIQHKLFAESKGTWKKLVPNLQDGLVTAANKSKGAYTWIPLGLTIAAAGVFTFYNQHITTKKHGGKIFFPGEGGPPIEGTQPINTLPLIMFNPMSSKLPSASIYRNFGAFPGFPQLRNSTGGVIA